MSADAAHEPADNDCVAVGRGVLVASPSFADAVFAQTRVERALDRVGEAAAATRARIEMRVDYWGGWS